MAERFLWYKDIIGGTWIYARSVDLDIPVGLVRDRVDAVRIKEVIDLLNKQAGTDGWRCD